MEIEITKICSDCKIEKSANEFTRRSTGTLFPSCLECGKRIGKKYKKQKPQKPKKRAIIVIRQRDGSKETRTLKKPEKQKTMPRSRRILPLSEKIHQWLLSADRLLARKFARFSRTDKDRVSVGIFAHIHACKKIGCHPNRDVVREILDDAKEGIFMFEEVIEARERKPELSVRNYRAQYSSVYQRGSRRIQAKPRAE